MKTQFKGNPLIESPSYNFLAGDYGKEFLEGDISRAFRSYFIFG